MLQAGYSLDEITNQLGLPPAFIPGLTYELTLPFEVNWRTYHLAKERADAKEQARRNIAQVVATAFTLPSSGPGPARGPGAQEGQEAAPAPPPSEQHQEGTGTPLSRRAPAAQTIASPTWIPLRPILVRYPLGSAKLERLKGALKSGRVRYLIDWGSIYIEPVPWLGQVDGRLSIVDEQIWDKCVDWHRGALDHPRMVPRPIDICEEDLEAVEADSPDDPANWPKQGQSPSTEQPAAHEEQADTDPDKAKSAPAKANQGGRPRDERYAVVAAEVDRLQMLGEG
jgi:hypothetical protein